MVRQCMLQQDDRQEAIAGQTPRLEYLITYKYGIHF